MAQHRQITILISGNRSDYLAQTVIFRHVLTKTFCTTKVATRHALLWVTRIEEAKSRRCRVHNHLNRAITTDKRVSVVLIDGKNGSTPSPPMTFTNTMATSLRRTCMKRLGRQLWSLHAFCLRWLLLFRSRFEGVEYRENYLITCRSGNKCTKNSIQAAISFKLK